MGNPNYRSLVYLVMLTLITNTEHQEAHEDFNRTKSVVSKNTGENWMDDNQMTSNLQSSLHETSSAFNETAAVFVTQVNTETAPFQLVPKLEVVTSPTTYQLDMSKSKRYLAQEVTDYVCKSEHFCNVSLSTRRFVCGFDCMPCQCDEQCHVYGDCCPDAAFRDSPDISSISNPYLICTNKNWRTSLNFTNIFMVGKCPPNSDPVIVQKCEFPDTTVQREATPVSAVEYNIPYRNSFCAICHGAIDFEIWKNKVNCTLLSEIQFATSKADLWRIVTEDKYCTIVTEPPDFVSLRECYPVTQNTCNGSGRATEDSDPVVKNLCDMYSHPVHYYGSSNTNSIPYRNAFCAMCDGVVLHRGNNCTTILSPVVGFPLSVLLEFNPSPERIVQEAACDVGQVVDPFSNTCVNISCPLRRYLVGNNCEDIFTSANGLGVRLGAILKSVDAVMTEEINEGILAQYSSMLNDLLQPFSPFTVSSISAFFYTPVPGHLLVRPAELIQIQANIISLTTQSLAKLESTLLNIMKRSFTYQNVDNSSTYFRSTPILCRKESMVPWQYEEAVHLRKMYSENLRNLDQSCPYKRCKEHIHFASVSLACPFIKYDLNRTNFTYFPDNNSILFKEHVFSLASLGHLECKGFLKICTDELVNINRILGLVNTPSENLTLSIVSLVCISLSLAGLVLTFTTYSLIPKLRTLPGMNTMALVLNLFLAQLLFLTTSNRTSNIILCQIFGVLIHYFWLSSFAWMSISAYHMFIVFTCLGFSSNSRDNNKRFISYSLVCNLLPILIIVLGLSVSFARSNDLFSGYGGEVCFLNHPTVVGGFFVAPLGLMLLLNMFFFVRTIQAIRSVPDMKTSSNQNNKHHMVVYIKLSLLLGFTWLFGILAEIIRSDGLNYVFVVFSGSQGVFLFMAYCLNEGTRSKLRDRLGRFGKNNASFSGPSTNSTT